MTIDIASTSPIRVWNYMAEYVSEREDILDAVRTVFESGSLILGPSLTAFEEAFARYHGVARTVGVDNGTNALSIALRAAGVRAGDEVITVSNTAAPTVVAIDSIGARPVFVDIVDDDTYLLDVSAVDAVVTDRTACILPVHMYGQCVNMQALKTLADRRGLMMVEDCAQAHGAKGFGTIAGSTGVAAGFSFYPTKVLGAYGDGGAVITDDPGVADRAKRLRRYGMDEKYYVVETPAYNSRLDDVQAEILRRKLTRLDTYIARRRKIADRYRRELADTSLVLPATAAGNEHVYYLYVVRHPMRESILRELEGHGVSLNVSYRWPVHTMSGFSRFGWRVGDLPITEAMAEQIFSLPMYPGLTDEQQSLVIDALHAVLRDIDG